MSVHPSRFLLWSVFVVALVALMAGPLPVFQPVWLVLLAVLVLLALSDALWSLRCCPFPRAMFPPLVRLTKDRPGAISFVVVGMRRGARFRFAPALPGSIESKEMEVTLACEQDLALGARLRFTWSCTPRLRGSFTGLMACFEQSSRLGFWHLQERQAQKCELRVYPNLFAEKRSLAALFLPRSQFGLRLRKTVGRGREFEKLRDYQAGDPYDEIHWKATAKRSNPITKVFQSERTQEVYVVIDASRLSSRSVQHEGRETTTLERYLNAAMILLLAASRQGDRFGLLVFDSRIRCFIRAGQGTRHYAACREAVYALSPSDGSPDVPELVRHLRASLGKRSLLFFLTDLTDPVLAEDFARYLGPLARQHLVLLNQLRPPGVERLFAGESVSESEQVYERLAGHLRWNETRSLIHALKAQGVSACLLESEALAEEMLTQYLRVKERQRL